MRYFAALLFALSVGSAMAQERQTFKDSMGRTTGWVNTDARGNSTFYDASARNTGRAVTGTNGTTFYDRMGRQTGTSSRRK